MPTHRLRLPLVSTFSAARWAGGAAVALLLLLTTPALAQTGVGIGTTAPDVSAALDIVSSTKGALLPRVAAATAIVTPATGLLVFQTGAPTGFYYNAGTPGAPSWQRLNVVGGAGDNLGNHTATQPLNLQGNALTGTGANIGSTVGVGVRADGGLNIGQNTTGNNIYLGHQAGASNTTGGANLFIGHQAGRANTTGQFNHVIGYFAGASNSSGESNQFTGFFAGARNTTGGNNHFDGHQAGAENRTGNNNVYEGFYAGQEGTAGSNNTFVGLFSGRSNQGSNNWGFGYQAGPASSTPNLTNAGAIGYNAQVTQSNSLVLGGTGADAVSVGIGTTAPDVSAALDIVSSSKGALLPRVAAATAIVTPATGLLVFQTGSPAGFYYNAGTPGAPDWQQLATATGAAITASNGLTKTGQNIALGGTLTGVTDINTNGNNLTLSGAGNVGIGTTTATISRLNISPVSVEPKITLYNGAGTSNYYGLGISGFQINYHTGSNTGNHVFYAGGTNGDGTELLRIRHNGNVGIGNPAPAQRLDVTGNAVVSGNVGIGNTAPSAKLHVSGNLRADLTNGSFTLNNFGPTSRETVLLGTFRGAANNAPELRFEGVGTTFMDIGQDSSGAFVVEGNDVRRLTVQRLGNVGIGTITPAGKLDIQGGADANGNNNPGGLALSWRNGGYRHFVRSRHNGTVTGGGNDLDFYLNNSPTAAGSSAAGTGNVQVLTLESNNGAPRVGIGTTTPTALLDLGSSAGALPTDAVTRKLALYNIASGNDFYGLGISAGSMHFFTNAAAGAEPDMTIRNAGNVGIGTTAPTQKLDVVGNAVVSGRIGIGTTTPFSQLANTSLNMNGSNSQGGNPNSLTWAASQTGFVTLLYNGQVGGGHGLAVKVAGNDVGTTVLDVSAGTAQTTVAPSLFKVRANGFVGVGVSGNPTATLHVGGTAGTANVRLESLGGTGTRLVTVDAGGNLSSSSAVTAFGTSFIQNGTTQQTSSNFNISGTGTVGGTLAAVGTVFADAANANNGTFTAGSPLKGVVFGSAGSGEGIGANRAGGPNGFGVDIYTNYTPRLSVANSGNVGIGTGTPGSRLAVVAADNSTNPIANFQPQNLTQGVSVTYNGIAKTGSSATSNLTLDGKSTGHVLLHTNGSSGNVGIGTSAPTQKLEVSGGGLFSGSLRLDGAQANNGTFPAVRPQFAGLLFGPVGTGETIGSNRSGGGDNPYGLDFYTGFDPRLRISQGGNVGINTPAPTARLDVNGSTRLRGLTTAGVVTTDASGNLSSATAASLDATTASNGLTKTGTAVGLGGTLTGATTIATAGFNLNLTGTGNVGIGTGAPRGQLDAAGPGDIYLVNSPNVGTAQSLFLPGHLYLAPYNGSNVSYLQARRADNSGTTALRLRTYNNGTLTEAMHLEGNGNVGIGTTNPTQKLEVAGGIRFTGAGSVLTFPDGTTQATAATGGGAADNLGNHTATQALNLQGQALVGTGASIAGVGVGVRADGGLNLGQNGPGNSIFLGYQAGANNAPNVGASLGIINQFFGVQAGLANTTGRQNLIVGYQAGLGNTTGNNNQFVGLQSGYTNTSGNSNTFSGAQSGYLNDAGIQNVFTGLQSGYNSTGNNNTFYGTRAGYENTTGSSNTALGFNSGPAVGSGALTNATAVGANVSLTQSNTVVLGNAANVGIGTSTPATRLDVNGNLRLAVRLCPVNGPGAYPLIASDIAFSVFKTQDGNRAAILVLPAAGQGQVVGQELTIYNRATASVNIAASNTDNPAGFGIDLAASGTAGVHAVKFLWDGVWVRVQ